MVSRIAPFTLLCSGVVPVFRSSNALSTAPDGRHELFGGCLHRRDQLIDVIVRREDLGFDLALLDIGTQRKQGSVEGAGEGGDGFRRGNRIRAIRGSTLHDAADAEIKWTAHMLHRVLAPLKCCLAVLGGAA
jgi:hypothetical protein